MRASSQGGGCRESTPVGFNMGDKHAQLLHPSSLSTSLCIFSSEYEKTQARGHSECSISWSRIERRREEREEMWNMSMTHRGPLH